MHITNAETVLFDKVFSNLASAYSEHTGIFKCPQSGMYVFHLHAYDMNTVRWWNKTNGAKLNTILQLIF